MVTAFKIPTSIVSSGTSYHASLDSRVRVGELADYLSANEPSVQASTLEMATPVPASRRLHWLNWQPGDRLAIFARRPQRGEFPAPLRPGDSVVRFSAQGLSVTSAGRRSLVIGKPDPTQAEAPDVDLRLLLPASALDFVSRQCLHLSFEPEQGTWFISRMGHTRVLLDEMELERRPVPLNARQRLTFFRASDEPRAAESLALGTVDVQVEAASTNGEGAAIRQGTEGVPVTLGLEDEMVIVRASESIQVDQIMTRLLDHRGVASRDARVVGYVLQLVPPGVELRSLPLPEGGFWYAAYTQTSDISVLQLVDVHDRRRAYTVHVDREDRAVRLGWRADGQPAEQLFDLDLQPSVVGQAMLPFDVVAQVRYRAAEKMWWLDPAVQSGAAVFVNSTRLGSMPLPLTSGDVLSFGLSVSHYFARFAVEIAARRA